MVPMPNNREVGNPGGGPPKIANIVIRSTHDEYADFIRKQPGGFRQSVYSLPTIEMPSVYNHPEIRTEPQLRTRLVFRQWAVERIEIDGVWLVEKSIGRQAQGSRPL